MMTWDERAAAEACHRDRADSDWYAIRAEELFRQGAEWQRGQLLTDETVERAARAVAHLDPGEDWPTNEVLGGGLTGTRDDEYRTECVEVARAVLTAAIGGQE